MTYIRGDVRELLLAGHTNREISRRLNVDPSVPARARTLLGLPTSKPGPRPAATVEDLFWRRAKPTRDGHMTGTGYHVNSNVPALRHGGRIHTAYRVAFRIANGRDPEGHAKPGCSVDGCVAPACQTDRATRAEERKIDRLHAAIFGGAS